MGRLTPTRLVETVKSRRDWGEATIKTLLGRLLRKHVIRSAREGGRLRYQALVTREMYVRAEIQTLADRLFEGDPDRLAAFIRESWAPDQA